MGQDDHAPDSSKDAWWRSELLQCVTQSFISFYGCQTNQAKNTFSCHLFVCVDQKHVINFNSAAPKLIIHMPWTKPHKQWKTTGSSRTLLTCSSSVDRQASVNIRLGVSSRKTHQRFSWIFLVGFFPVKFTRDAEQARIIRPRPPFYVYS